MVGSNVAFCMMKVIEGWGESKKCFRRVDDKVTFLVQSNLNYPASRERASMVRIIESPDNGKYGY